MTPALVLSLLLMTPAAGPQPEVRLADACSECLDFCAADYQDCRSSGLPIGVCWNQRTACRNDCLANECS